MYFFEPGNTENRRIFYELFDYKLPEDKNGTLLNLLYITNSNAVHKDFPLYFYNKHYGKRNSNLDLYLSDIYNEYISYLKNADRKQISTEHIKTRNEKLEGKVHPVTSVPFVRKTITVNDRVYDVVVPEFESLFDAQIGEELFFKRDRIQFKECNRQLLEAVNSDVNVIKRFSEAQLEQIRNGEVPDGYVWHHDAEAGKLQLVDRALHERTGHTGGKKIWSGGKKYR